MDNSESQSDNWTLIIKPKKKWHNLSLSEIFNYADLLFLLVRRDFVSVYKQTVLGPLWYIIQPILQTITFTVIFGKIANISTDGTPPVLFYMAGITCWGYFAECLNKTSNTFTANAGIFGKVYFPRIIIPISIVMSNLFKFLVQIILFVSFLLFYKYYMGAAVFPNKFLLMLPVLLILMAGLGLGFGIVISSLTTKYRDFQFLVGFGVQLLMYASPVIFPLSVVRGTKFETVLLLNPMTSIIEAFKYGFFGSNVPYDFSGLVYSTVFMVCIIFMGLLIFNKVEKTFMDTV